MALSLDQLQAQREAILNEMGNASHVQFMDRSVTYRPQAELEAALRQMDAEIARLQNPASRQFTVQSNRGF